MINFSAGAMSINSGFEKAGLFGCTQVGGGLALANRRRRRTPLEKRGNGEHRTRQMACENDRSIDEILSPYSV
jgi:hypothetical protein